MMLFVDISWTFPKSSLFTDERSCWFPETTRSFINKNKLHQTIWHQNYQLLLFQTHDHRLIYRKYNNANWTHKHTVSSLTSVNKHYSCLMQNKQGQESALPLRAAQLRNLSTNLASFKLGTLGRCPNYLPTSVAMTAVLLKTFCSLPQKYLSPPVKENMCHEETTDMGPWNANCWYTGWNSNDNHTLSSKTRLTLPSIHWQGKAWAARMKTSSVIISESLHPQDLTPLHSE